MHHFNFGLETIKIIIKSFEGEKEYLLSMVVNTFKMDIHFLD